VKKPEPKKTDQQTAEAAPRPASGSLSGATPVVPSGSFDTRWPTFR
jgi:hypothetical protein